MQYEIPQRGVGKGAQTILNMFPATIAVSCSSPTSIVESQTKDTLHKQVSQKMQTINEFYHMTSRLRV